MAAAMVFVRWYDPERGNEESRRKVAGVQRVRSRWSKAPAPVGVEERWWRKQFGWKRCVEMVVAAPTVWCGRAEVSDRGLGTKNKVTGLPH